jgi:hypothetical protein
VIYIVDATAIVEIFAIGPSSSVSESLTQFVERSQVTFPDDVIHELRAHYKEDACYAWAVGIRKSRAQPGVPWEDKVDVEQAVPSLVDPDNPHEQCGPAVLAQSKIWIEQQFRVTVVTDDCGAKPGGRMSIAKACDVLGIPWMRPAQFLAAMGL